MGTQERSRILAVLLLFPSSGLYWCAGKENPTSWAILLPLVCQHQLPKMTRDRVGETPWDSAKSGPGGFWSIPPLKRPHGSSSSALVSLGRSQFTFSSTLQIAHKFLDTICLHCPEQDQNLPLQNLQHPPGLQPTGFFPIISDQRPADKV